MKEWIVVASRAEAKIFERENKKTKIKWLETLTNKKGRKRERDFDRGSPGVSYAKFSGSCTPHNLEGKHSHSETISNKFAHKIGHILKSNHDLGEYKKATVFASPHLLGLIKSYLAHHPGSLESYMFIPKNLENAKIEKILEYLD